MIGKLISIASAIALLGATAQAGTENVKFPKALPITTCFTPR